MLKNTKPTHLERESEFKLQGLKKNYEATPNFLAKSNFITKTMVEINPPSIKQLRSRDVWRRNVFNRHLCGDKKLSIVNTPNHMHTHPTHHTCTHMHTPKKCSHSKSFPHFRIM